MERLRGQSIYEVDEEVKRAVGQRKQAVSSSKWMPPPPLIYVGNCTEMRVFEERQKTSSLISRHHAYS
jgi:hypothetical protein